LPRRLKWQYVHRSWDSDSIIDPVLQCVTKSVILHLQWQEGNAKPIANRSTLKFLEPGTLTMSQFQRIPTNLSCEAAPHPRLPAPRCLFLPPTSALPRYSYSRGSASKGHLSTTVPRMPIMPIWPSPRTGTILSPLPIRYGRAAILTVPPR